eukprot:scaffold1219_cov400-Prasinococcus_capsulatus_cf.AAC.20
MTQLQSGRCGVYTSTERRGAPDRMHNRVGAVTSVSRRAAGQGKTASCTGPSIEGAPSAHHGPEAPETDRARDPESSAGSFESLGARSPCPGRSSLATLRPARSSAAAGDPLCRRGAGSTRSSTAAGFPSARSPPPYCTRRDPGARHYPAGAVHAVAPPMWASPA